MLSGDMYTYPIQQSLSLRASECELCDLSDMG